MTQVHDTSSTVSGTIHSEKLPDIAEALNPKRVLLFQLTIQPYHLNGQAPDRYQQKMVADLESTLHNQVIESAAPFFAKNPNLTQPLTLGLIESCINVLNYGVLGWTRPDLVAIEIERKKGTFVPGSPLYEQLRTKIKEAIDSSSKVMDRSHYAKFEMGIEGDQIWFSIDQFPKWDILSAIATAEKELEARLEIPGGRGLILLNGYFKIHQEPNCGKITFRRSMLETT